MIHLYQSAYSDRLDSFNYWMFYAKFTSDFAFDSIDLNIYITLDF